jgi:hypothetical protein
MNSVPSNALSAGTKRSYVRRSRLRRPEDTGLLPRPIPAEIFLHIKFKRLRDDGLVSIWDTRFPRFWYAFD